MKQIIIILTVVLSFSAFAQTTKKENQDLHAPRRLDTIYEFPSDSIFINEKIYKITIGKHYTSSIMPKCIVDNMLIFIDKCGNVQNYVVTKFDYTILNNEKYSKSIQNNFLLSMPLINANLSIGASTTISNVIYVDLNNVMHKNKIKKFKIIRIK